MAEILSEAHDDAWYLFVTAHAKLTERIDRRLAERRALPLEWYDVLLALKRADGRKLRLNELAERVTLSRSGLTRLVDRVESAGLLRREQCPTDRRGAFAVITGAGLKALTETWPIYRQAIVEYFATHVTEREARVIASALTRALKELG
jgi:DNA-binding MarR family transcriptional regulator